MGIFFAILSPAIYSVNNYIDKFLLSKYDIHPILLAVYTGFLSLIVGIILYLVIGFASYDTKSVFLIILSGILTGLYILPYFKALSSDETSRVVPLFQFTPVIVMILSGIFLKESFSLTQYMGALLIIFAGYVISLEKYDVGMFKIRPAFWYMLLSSSMFAGSLVLYKFGVNEISFWHTLLLECLGIMIGSVLILMYPGNFSIVINQVRQHKKIVLFYISINECCYLLARYTGYFALSLLPATLVSILGGFQPLFVLIYGIILSVFFPKIIKEVIDKKTLGIKTFAILLILIGLIAIFY